MNLLRKFTFFIIAVTCTGLTLFGQAQWPKDIPLSNGGKITMYEPQPESLNGNDLTGRAAISVKKTADDEPVFGAAWFNATIETNKDDRTARLESMTITKAKFADSSSQQDVDNLTSLIEQEAPNWNMDLSLDQLLTSIKQEKQVDDANLKTDPPKIIYKTRPATLVLIDGQPRVKMDNNMKVERVLNSPFLIIKYPADNKYYLYARGFWYNSSSVTDGYTYVKDLPSQLKDLDNKIKERESKDENIKPEDRPTKPTDIIVSTEPAELIQTEGEASYKSIQGTHLLYADNTLDEIFKDIGSQQTFTLISGRWYSAPNLNGQWTYTPSDKLPADFAKIPKGSEKDGVLASVAGTDEANEAVTDAQIPQTVKVDRKTAQCNVTYDGEPKFSKIDNTSLEVAENSNITVMRAADGNFYALDNGIWFTSSNAGGPWEVANQRPQDVEKIPPSNQAYNSKYAYIYDNTPDYVYMGYTPGYMGSYVYGPTVVYGTGWYYQPWYGTFYYPRPITYGFGFNYNPWAGWSMSWGMGFNFAWYNMIYPGGYYGPWGGGWFGPPMYRPPYCGWGWHGGYYGGGYGYQRPMPYSRPGVVVNRPVRVNVSNTYNNVTVVNNNIYNRRAGATTKDISRGPVSTRSSLSNSNPGTNNPLPTNARPVARPSTLPNNVITDRNGNVFKKDGKGNWEQRDNRQWKPATSERMPDLNKSQLQRDRANIRNNNYIRSQQVQQRPSIPPNRPVTKPTTPAPKPAPKQPR